MPGTKNSDTHTHARAHTNARGGFSLMVDPGLKHRSVNNSGNR